MEENQNIEQYNCPLCNYKTTNNAQWIRHNETKKHLRNGNLLPKKCSLCDYEALNHWNLKMHYASIHATIEEKKNHKYYCNTCDLVFFCKAYYDKHVNGLRHKNTLKALNYQVQVNEIAEKLNNN